MFHLNWHPKCKLNVMQKKIERQLCWYLIYVRWRMHTLKSNIELWSAVYFMANACLKWNLQAIDNLSSYYLKLYTVIKKFYKLLLFHEFIYIFLWRGFPGMQESFLAHSRPVQRHPVRPMLKKILNGSIYRHTTFPEYSRFPE